MCPWSLREKKCLSAVPSLINQTKPNQKIKNYGYEFNTLLKVQRFCLENHEQLVITELKTYV